MPLTPTPVREPCSSRYLCRRVRLATVTGADGYSM